MAQLLRGEPNDVFWAHEWEKHGTCAEDVFPTQLDYFNSTVELDLNNPIEARTTRPGQGSMVCQITPVSRHPPLGRFDGSKGHAHQESGSCGRNSVQHAVNMLLHVQQSALHGALLLGAGTPRPMCGARLIASSRTRVIVCPGLLILRLSSAIKGSCEC